MSVERKKRRKEKENAHHHRHQIETTPGKASRTDWQFGKNLKKIKRRQKES